MATEIRVGYLYMEEATRKQYELACEHIGWTYKALAQHLIHGFLAKNRSFYVEAIRKDFEARGMSERDYYRALRDGSEADVKPYQGTRPNFGASPLDPIPLIPTGKENQVKYGKITLSNFNLVFLKAAQLIDQQPMLQVISRIIKLHFLTYWESNYAPQIDLDEKCLFSEANKS